MASDTVQVKFSDGTALTRRTTRSESAYRKAVDDLACRGDERHLDVTQTKENGWSLTFRSSPLPPIRPQPSLLVVRGKEVEVVYPYKYLGTILDDSLDWSANAESPQDRSTIELCKDTQILQRLFQTTRTVQHNNCGLHRHTQQSLLLWQPEGA